MTRSLIPRPVVLACALFAALAASACQSSRLEDLAPLAGARNTGTTPDLNVTQTAATTQFSDADKNAKVSELQAAQANQAAQAQGAPASTTPAALRKAAQQQAATLKTIEGE